MIHTNIEFHPKFVEMLKLSHPFYASRLGGSDTNAVVDYFINVLGGRRSLDEHLEQFFWQCAKLNGFFVDQSQNAIDQYLNYLQILDHSYKKANVMFLCNWQWIRLYYSHELCNTPYQQVDANALEAYVRYAERIGLEDKCVASYSYFENLATEKETFLWALRESYQNKNILLVTSHVNSIARGLCNINQIFPGYSYGNIEINLHRAPVTYFGTDASKYPGKSWPDVLRSLAEDLSVYQFGQTPLVLLACGSYALPLGQILLGHFAISSVYVGGILQLFFGVQGGRWKQKKYDGMINHRYLVKVSAEDNYTSLVDNSQEPSSAYF